MPAKRSQSATPPPVPADERFIPGDQLLLRPLWSAAIFPTACLKFVVTEELCGREAAARDGQTQNGFRCPQPRLEEARQELEKVATKAARGDEDALREASRWRNACNGRRCATERAKRKRR